MAPPTNDELLSLETLGAPTLSPLGDLVVFTVTSTDWEQDSFVSQLWLAPADGSSPPRQLTTDKSGASGPQWSPDGTYITFVASRGGAKPQLYALPVAGGEAVCLTAADRGVSGHAWSPDGSTIAFLAMEPETEAWKERKDTFGDFVLFRSPTDQEHTHIWTLDVAAALVGEPSPGVQRTSGKDFTCSAGFGGTPLRWAPGSRTKLAFVGTANPDMTAGNTATVYILDISAAGAGEGSVTPLIKQPGADGNPRWSPCGGYIAYTSQIGRTANALNSILCVLPAEVRI
jgi:Tol biopolymer transport system component